MIINKSQNTDLSPIYVLRDIIKAEMSLKDERVLVYNPKYTLPNDDQIFVVISFLGSKVYSNRSKGSDINTNFTEVQNINVMESYDISIFSRNEDALFRKEEILMALSSQYSKNLQSTYGIKIFHIPQSLIDTSDIEATARLYRFSATVNLLAAYSKSIPQDYYDQFPIEVLSDDSGIDKTFTEPEGD